ncbi:MAG: hypothetical protein ACHQNT_03605 [Bacteroidia bacterium]
MKKKKKKVISKVKEPAAAYKKKNGGNKIVFFNSFEEMNEYDQKEMARLTPVQRLQNITGMLMEVYRIELKKPVSDMSIYFK